MTLTFGHRLKVARAKAAMSSQALADATGMTRAVIQNIESGRKKNVTVDEVVAFSEVLNVPLGDLDERLAHPETLARREDHRAALLAQIARLQAELEAVPS